MWEASNYCHDHIRIIRFIDKNPWFKHRYMRLTYNDICTKPLEYAEQIYSFIEEELPANLKEYITNITSAQSEGYQTRNENFQNVYRNSTDKATNWMGLDKGVVTLGDVYSIEWVCRPLFRLINEHYRAGEAPRKFLDTLLDV